MWSDDSIGWLAALVAALAYGSFGVPIKATRHIECHPLLFQSIKTCVMFALSWNVLWLKDVHVAWTPWGVLSGLLWVLGGTGGVYAIRLAGLATAVGTWASVMIVVSFCWGFLVFDEPVADLMATITAFGLVIVGLVGMSWSSAPSLQPPQFARDNVSSYRRDRDWDAQSETPSEQASREGRVRTSIGNDNDDDASYDENGTDDTNNAVFVRLPDEEGNDGASSSTATRTDQVEWCGLTVSTRVAGIGGAVFNGVMTGSSLVPVHYAKKHGLGGAHYMLSFAAGALLSNIALWACWIVGDCIVIAIHRTRGSVRLVPHVGRTNSGEFRGPAPTTTTTMTPSILRQAVAQLPTFHYRALWWPGLLAGTLLTIAMFGSILAVTYLGQGVGYSVVQLKLLVSGVWGIAWYHEIRGRYTITAWLLSASITLAGMIWLGVERLQALADAAEENDVDRYLQESHAYSTNFRM